MDWDKYILLRALLYPWNCGPRWHYLTQTLVHNFLPNNHKTVSSFCSSFILPGFWSISFQAFPSYKWRCSTPWATITTQLCEVLTYFPKTFWILIHFGRGFITSICRFHSGPALPLGCKAMPKTCFSRVWQGHFFLYVLTPQGHLPPTTMPLF